jgi:hypothetical protein
LGRPGNKVIAGGHFLANPTAWDAEASLYFKLIEIGRDRRLLTFKINYSIYIGMKKRRERQGNE